jgi:hypothetical protein
MTAASALKSRSNFANTALHSLQIAKWTTKALVKGILGNLSQGFGSETLGIWQTPSMQGAVRALYHTWPAFAQRMHVRYVGPGRYGSSTSSNSSVVQRQGLARFAIVLFNDRIALACELLEFLAVHNLYSAARVANYLLPLQDAGSNRYT